MVGGIIRGWRHDARTATELAHARPAYAAGFRAAIATVAPLLASALLPGGGATWMSLAGLNGALIDRGCPYRMRAAIMTALALASAVAVFVGSLLGGNIVVAVIATFIIALLCGLTRGWVEIGPGFGVTVLVTYAIALALPVHHPVDALVRAGYVIAGGAWAILLAVVLWPLRPYRPVRLRVAECYRAIARYLETARAELGAGEFRASALTPHVVAIRGAIEAARTALALSRRGRSVESRRGERLLVLHEIADQIFVHLLALLELSDRGSRGPMLDPEHLVLSATLQDTAKSMRALAAAVESETDVPAITIPWDGAGMREINASMGEIVDRIADYARAAVETVASLNGGTPPRSEAIVAIAAPPEQPPLFSWDAIVRPASVVKHHALRVAIVTSAAVLIARLFHLNHGYWVTLTAVVILQPFAAMTRQKALQRVVGTILGAMVAAALSAFFQGGIAVLVLIAIFTWLCVALLPLNYGAYAVFGTPAFVLLAEASIGDWHLAGLRIVNTLIGGGLALAGAELLWPGEERNRLPELVASAIRANAALLARAVHLVGSGQGDVGSLRDARREVANAALNAEDSFQRLMSEHRGAPDEMEPIMATLVYVRRLAASTAALAVSPPVSPVAQPAMASFGRAADAILTDLAEATKAGREPAPFPPMGSVLLPDATTAPEVYPRVTRLARQLKLMHDAVARWPRSVLAPPP